MKCYETEHYFFNYEEGSLAEKEIFKLSSEQERCYEYIVNVLGKEPKQKINYFLYEDAKVLGKKYSEFCEMEYQEGFAINGFSSGNNIYAVYSEQTKCMGFHEDAHNISMSDGRWSESTAILEGLAMYFDRMWWSIHNLHWTRFFIKFGKFIPVDRLICDNDYFYSLGSEITYPIMGAFTEWLMSTYGTEKYISFFNEEDAEAAATKVYQKSIGELNSLFMNYVLLFNNDDEVEYRMNKLLTEENL